MSKSDILEWFISPDHESGVVLFEQHSPHSPTKTEILASMMRRGGRTAQETLRNELIALRDSMAIDRSATKTKQPFKPTAADKPVIERPVTKRKSHDDYQDLPPELLKLKQANSTYYAEMNRVRGAIFSSKGLKNDQWRASRCKKVSEIYDRILDNYAILDHYRDTGEILVGKDYITVHRLKMIDLLTGALSDRNYIHKYGGKSDKAKEVANRRNRLQEVQDFIAQLKNWKTS